MSPVAFLTLAVFAPGQVPPKLDRGDEFVYTGSVAETVDRPGNRFRRRHDLELRVFVLDRRDTWADVAVLTLLRRTEDVVGGAVGAVTGANPARGATPPAARLDIVRVHADGTVHHLLPPAPVPLKLDTETPARLLPPVPLDSFAPFEFGMFPPRPPRDVAPDRAWPVTPTDPRAPAEEWRVKGTEFLNAERCAELGMVQQSAGWAKPVGGQTDWQRTDSVWVSTRDGTARRVHRTIRQRDGIADTPAVWVEVKYALSDQTRIGNRTYDRYRYEIELAYSAAADAAPLLPDAARLGPRPFDVRLARLDAHLREFDPGTPYREAVFAVRRQLDAARKGEALPVSAAPVAPAVIPPKVPDVGDPAPGFTAGAFRPADHRGKPVVLVFFKPGMETTDLALAVADGMATRYAGRIAVAPLVLFADAETAAKDRDRLKLGVPVFDGEAAGAALGVETFPRFVLIDGAGTIRWVFRGVGAETGYLACREVEKLLTSPAPPTAPPGTTGPPTPGFPPVPRRP